MKFLEMPITHQLMEEYLNLTNFLVAKELIRYD